MTKRPPRSVATIKSNKSADPGEPGPRRMGDAVVEVDAVYHVPAIQPTGDGPWKLEAEKVAWTDAATGLQCIVRRAKGTGHLCGYVAVPTTHPLYGWEARAVRQLGVSAHGGISYADRCQHYEPESISICHVPTERRQRAAESARRRAHMAEAAHDNLWWLGFECDQVYDVVPNPPRGHRDDPTAGTMERVYRDEGYVRLQCESLAAQLQAIGEGRPLPPPADAPPLGLDPREAGAR